MPKNTEENLYLNPAIPRNTRLAEYLEESSGRSGITKSQLLIWFAAEYVRLVVDGGNSVAAPAPAVVATKPASPEGKLEQNEIAQGSIRTLTSLATDDTTNYGSMFGEPD